YELNKLNGVLGQLICSESFVNEPIVVHGGGPRVRMYCVYNDEAVEGDDADERTLTASPTGDGWSISVPCSDEDFDWVAKELGKIGQRATARRFGEEIADESEEKSSASANIDMEAFLKS